MKKIRAAILLMAVLLLVSCVENPRFGKTATDKLVAAMTASEMANLLTVQNGRTAAIERLAIPSIAIAQVDQVPESDMLARSGNSLLARQAGSMIALDVISQGAVCVLCPVIPHEITAVAGQLTASLANGIEAEGAGIVISSFTPDLETVINQSAPWAVITPDSIPQVQGFDGAVFTSSGVPDTLTAPEMAPYVFKVLSFLEKVVAIDLSAQKHADPDTASFYRNVVEQGMVLLKNNGVLPVKRNQRLALYSPNSYRGFDQDLKKKGYALEPSVVTYYTRNSDRERQPFQYRADAIASYAAIVTFCDSVTVTEQKVLKEICDAFHFKSKKVVVILESDSPVQTASWINLPDAVLYAGRSSHSLYSVVSKIISGEIQPVGHLSSSWGEPFPAGYGLSY